MKKIFTLLLMFALVTGVTFAQSTAPATEEAAPAAVDGPVMSFETMTVDYGTIEQNSDPLRSFLFTNTGNAPLQITHAKGSCGCTVPDYPKQPIMPGEQAKIDVRYDTKRIGKFVKTVTLTTNETAGRQKLTIKGEVLKKKPEPAGLPSSEPNVLSPVGGK